MLYRGLTFIICVAVVFRSLQIRMESNGTPAQRLPVVSQQQDSSSLYSGLKKDVRKDFEELRPQATKRTYGNMIFGPVKMFKECALAEQGLQ